VLTIRKPSQLDVLGVVVDVEVAGVAAIEVLRTTSMFLVSVAVIFVLLFQAP